MGVAFFLLYLIFTITILYREMKSPAWEIGSAVYLLVASAVIGMPWWSEVLVWTAIVSTMFLIHAEQIRLKVTQFIFKRAERSMPKLSKTEEEALNAGETWIEEDLFRGTPNWERLANISTELSSEEQAFLDNETQVLCSMLNDWEITQNQDLPASVWTYMKDNGFFGLVIAKDFGGRGFSARAHSDIVAKIATRSSVAAVTVMVPNSLGPGELLHHYGTDEQKKFYLPRLAKGIDIPCFALTEPEAGSDATSVKSEAIVFETSIGGSTQLALNISLNKRWITLAPVATLIGVAVNLKDPHGLLNGVGTEGITCVLLPRDCEHLEIGPRHFPASVPFMNGTVRGENIIVPITSIIGGQSRAGSGWQMLVECLSIGRSISLPALATASSSVAYLSSSAFARVRRQFNVEIGQFEGIQEKLAEIAGLNYMITATRLLTIAAVNQHKKPSVASAITKYFNTELARITINHAMDIHAGRAVVVGPRNYLVNYYQSIPISITVEGANIMSRNLLIFGQGSMACHPFVRQEFYALSRQDQATFHTLLWQHIHYFLRNFARACASSWTDGLLIQGPDRDLSREYQRLTRLSYMFAWVSDLSLIVLGGSLKRKERLSARLADVMSYLYISMAVIRQMQSHKNHEDQRLHAKWALAYCFYHAEQAMMQFCNNFPSRILRGLMKVVMFPWGRRMHAPSDKLDHQLAQRMMQNNDHREQLLKIIYLSNDPNQPLDRMEHAFQLLVEHGHLEQKIKDLKRCHVDELANKMQKKVDDAELTSNEAEDLLRLLQARWDAIQVDEFAFEPFLKKNAKSMKGMIEEVG